MKIFGFDISREKRASPEMASVPVSAKNFMEFFGVNSISLPSVTIDSALTVPAFANGVRFLSRTMAGLPLHAYKATNDGPKRLDKTTLEWIVHSAPNPEQGAFGFWQHFWQGVFTGGRGLAYIERTAGNVSSLWPMDPAKTSISRKGGAKSYEIEGKIYSAREVIDVPFMLRSDGLTSYGPVTLAARAIQMAIAMEEYGAKFFAGGGVPPLALVGPMPAGGEAFKRAMADIHRSIDEAKKNSKPIVAIPPGYELKPVGFEPEKGQMTDARKFQITEIARALDLPPFFLQDLENAHYANAEQQDLHLVKHLVSQWAKALEDEINLKFFGEQTTPRYVEFNLDGLMRGDLKSRIEALAAGVNSALITPNEARAIENRPKMDEPAADKLHIQGATVPLGTPAAAAPDPNADQQSQNDMARSLVDALAKVSSPTINVDARTEVKPADVRVAQPAVEITNVIPKKGATKRTAQFDKDNRMIGMIEEEIE